MNVFPTHKINPLIPLKQKSWLLVKVEIEKKNIQSYELDHLLPAPMHNLLKPSLNNNNKKK